VIPARHATFIAVVGCGLVSACGSSPPAPTTPPAHSPSASSTALAGTPLRAEGFTTVVPLNWTNKAGDAAEVAKFSGGGKVEMLIEQAPPGQVQPNINDVTANINVLLLGSAVPPDQVATYLQSVSNNGATNLSAPQSVTIDGATGQFITYDRDIQGTPGESQDMIINHGATTYDIVLNTSQFAFSQQQPALQAVLAAWHWNS
jgi:hypothetical protein